MSDDRDDFDAGDAASAPGKIASGDAPRVRFRGIVETRAGDVLHILSNRDERRWNDISRQVWLGARLTAIFVMFAVLVGLPIGNLWAYVETNGSFSGWNIINAYRTDYTISAVIGPILVLFMGYLVSVVCTMLAAASSIANAAQQFMTPDESAAKNADSVGAVVQGHMNALNEGLDGALGRLASVEAMIRQHVEAIEIAGEAIEQRATGAVTRVADERSRLMTLTESLNAHADSFAAAIAERAKASIKALEEADTLSLSVERDFDERLRRLEDAAANALESFEALRGALRDTDETMLSAVQSIDQSASQTEIATKRATAAANEAAESAARNAANVAASAMRATDAAREAADKAIGAAAQEAERVARDAIEAATRESAKVQTATQKTLGEISRSTKGAIDAAVGDAAKATKAAEDVSEAARIASEAAAKASADVTAASERARESSQTAMKFSEEEAARIEERNRALAAARAALEEENARLESLIDEQRKRADRLADAIASQTERLSRLAEAQLREQEAAARLAEAQNEMQARADKQAEEKKRLEAAEAERRAREDAARKAEARAKPQPKPAQPADADTPLELKPAARTSDKSRGAGARLEELARDIAERRPRRQNGDEARDVSASQDKKRKGDLSWREILDAADDAEPLELGPAARKGAQSGSAREGAQSGTAREGAAAEDTRKIAAKTPPKQPQAPDEENAIRIISRLQQYTYDLETRLYGDPPPALAERFERGDRNVFANRLLRLNESDVKRRIRNESARDKEFERSVHSFLQGFERLLEDATTSETADEELEEYLSSPLGRVYLLVGATVGYFA